MQEHENEQTLQPSKTEAKAPKNKTDNSSGTAPPVHDAAAAVGVTLPDLAVAAANACHSPTYLNAKNRLLPDKPSGALARVKKLSVTVPSRTAGGKRTQSPASDSPTPTDFSPMLLPRAEATLSALISEHNQQQQALRLQQQFQLQLQQLQLQQQQQQLQQQGKSDGQDLVGTNKVLLSVQPEAKRQRLSTRGRKRHSDLVNSNVVVQAPLTLNGVGSTTAGSHIPARRSALGSTTLSVDTEDGLGSGTSMRKGPWLPEEDAKLVELVGQYGAYDWSFIAEHIPGRVGKQCRERYFNHLAPDVRKEAWTEREDDAIIHAHHIVGNKWTNIAKMLGNGRSPNSIKNRWHSSLKNRLSEHGGEAVVMEATGSASGCQCDCKKCECTCRVACVAFKCQCCSSSHRSAAAVASDDAQTVSANTVTDDEYTTSGSASSSTTTTPASAPSGLTPAPAAAAAAAAAVLNSSSSSIQRKKSNN